MDCGDASVILSVLNLIYVFRYAFANFHCCLQNCKLLFKYWHTTRLYLKVCNGEKLGTGDSLVDLYVINNVQKILQQ